MPTLLARPAGPPAADVRPSPGGVGRSTSKAAEEVGHTPDSTLGLVSGGISLVLAGMGGPQRASERPLLPLAMFGKAVLDATNGAYLFAEQVTKHKKVCSYCPVCALALVASVPAAWPEARDALRGLRRS